MNSKSFFAITAALTSIGSASALAAGAARNAEVQTPSSVSESAPWASVDSRLVVPDLPGTAGIPPVKRAPAAAFDTPNKTSATTDYWHLGEKKSGTGAADGTGSSGSVGFDSSTDSLK